MYRTHTESSMKVFPSVKKICDKCKVIRRHGRVMVILSLIHISEPTRPY